MKHVRLFEQFLNERFVTDRDIVGWEKDNGKLPFPAEVIQAAKKMKRYGLADENRLTFAHLWFIFNDGSWISMEKFGPNVKKFYGSDFYDLFNGGYDNLYMKAKYYASEIISFIEDKINNDEEVEPAYYEAKEYFKNFGMDYNRNRVFDSTVKHIEEWLKKNHK